MSTTTEGIEALRDRLIAVETKLDILLGQLSTTHQDHEARIRVLEQRVDPPTIADHETRLRRVERAVWLWAGAAAAAGAGIGTFLTSLMGG